MLSVPIGEPRSSAVVQVLRKDFPHADSVTVGEGVVMMTSRSRGVVQLYSIDTVLQVTAGGDALIGEGCGNEYL